MSDRWDDVGMRIIFDGVDLSVDPPKIRPLSPAEVGRRIYARWCTESRPATLGTTKGGEVERGGDLCGWGLVCRPDLEPATRECLQPLVQWRNGRVYPYDGERSLFEWTLNLQAQGCPLPTGNMYLLLVGSPAREDGIPFDFEKMLAARHAVGRLHLPDADAYARYVQMILDSEAKGDKVTHVNRRLVEFYAPDDTEATHLSCEQLARPLMSAIGDMGGFGAQGLLGQAATRENIVARMQTYRGVGAPAVTFLLSHGADVGQDLRAEFQGSWVPQGAPLPGETTPADEVRQRCLTGYDFAGGDLSLHGSVVVNFSCFGAGLHGEFTLRKWLLEDEVVPDDPRPLVSALGRNLLGNPYPALAYVSTLDDKTNVFSLLPNGLDVFREFVSRLLGGEPVGAASRLFWMESRIHDKSAEQLMEGALQARQTPQTLPERDAWLLGIEWLMADELDDFVVLGDPAARLSPIRSKGRRRR